MREWVVPHRRAMCYNYDGSASKGTHEQSNWFSTARWWNCVVDLRLPGLPFIQFGCVQDLYRFTHGQVDVDDCRWCGGCRCRTGDESARRFEVVTSRNKNGAEQSQLHRRKSRKARLNKGPVDRLFDVDTGQLFVYGFGILLGSTGIED
jgi:hypothetical protein